MAIITLDEAPSLSFVKLTLDGVIAGRSAP
jgi:hypothetical protein